MNLKNRDKKNLIAGYLTLGLALLFIFGGLGWYNYRAFSGPDQLTPESGNCQEVQAEITDRFRPSGYKNTGATLVYSYTIAGKEYSKREYTDESTYLLHLKRDRVAICVDRSDPENCNIIGNEDTSTSRIKVIVIDVIMFLVMIFVIVMARREGNAGNKS